MTTFGSAGGKVDEPISSNPDTFFEVDAIQAGSTGVIIGKFLPPHRGHEYLGHFASAFVDNLWIFVCSLPGDPIPGQLRVTWMGKIFPRARVIHIQEVNPAANRQKPGAQQIWARAVMEHLEHQPDYVFASEEYGWEFARSLGARFIPVDPSRDQFPISGTELRSRPFRHWHYLPDVVRPHFVRELMIDIPDAGPKLAEEIIRKAAMLLNTLYVPVYVHFYQGFADSTAHQLDSQTRTKAQTALISSLKSQARCFLLRSDLEHDDSNFSGHTPDLVIRLKLSGNQAGTGSAGCHVDNIPDNSIPGSPAVIDLSASQETAAHAIRDLALDRYKDWF